MQIIRNRKNVYISFFGVTFIKPFIEDHPKIKEVPILILLLDFIIKIVTYIFLEIISIVDLKI